MSDDSDRSNFSDEEVEEVEEAPKKGRGKKAENGDVKKGAAKKGGGGGGKKGTGFTKSCKLSKELAAVVGAEEMPRHEVVKKMWAIIKERNLYDPKNKQFAICDDQLLKVFGVKRFRTFGMLKYLKTHFV